MKAKGKFTSVGVTRRTKEMLDELKEIMECDELGYPPNLSLVAYRAVKEALDRRKDTP